MRKPLFTGICTALVTPFMHEHVNYPLAEQLLRRQIDAGIGAVVLAGTTGESSTLTDSEKIELFRRGKQFADKQCLIIAGTGSNSTAHAVELSKEAEAAGADALLIVSPYYNKATDDGLYAHYLSIAHAVSIPIILYNVPSRTGVDIPVSVYKRLSSVPNICGVKEASTDIRKIINIRQDCPEDFCVWTGNDHMIVPSVSLGCQGAISVLSNVLPIETKSLCDAAIAGSYSTAAKLQCKLMPIIDLMFCEVNPIPVKAAMRLVGYDCGDCRLPLTSLSKENARRMESFFQ